MNIFETSRQIEIIIVQAGATDLDDQGRITGALDLPLCDAGLIEAKEIATELSSHSIDAIFCANCESAQQTAAEIARASGARVKTEETWTNLDHGLWHGKCLEELKENQPKLYRQWQENPSCVCPPGGETFEEVRKRVASSIKRIRRKRRSGVIALVAPEPLYSVVRQEIEASIVDGADSTRQSSLRWESIELAGAIA